MDNSSNRALQQFKSEVGLRFQLYNSLFTSLPFHRIEKTGILLSLLANNCDEGYKKHLSPVRIIEDFIAKHTSYKTEKDKTDLLFRFVQYVERQVVLFDALEDAAFAQVHDLNGIGTLKQLESEVIQEHKEKELAEKLREFSVRLVLTAHPTQFYPGPVLGIINDLSKALAGNNANLINTYLQQLGKTPFFKKKKPTPYDEAISLIWYLENVFYTAAGRILSNLKSQFPDAVNRANPIVNMGFWPGGDMDGNPFVTSDITRQVAEALRGAILKCYYLDVRKLKRRLTFSGIDVLLSELENKLYKNLFIPGAKTQLTRKEILNTLEEIRRIVIEQHNGLFLHLVNNLINKIEIFGLHFASLDIRQESSIHGKILNALAGKGEILPADYPNLSNEEKMKLIGSVSGFVNPDSFEDTVHQNTLKVIASIKEIQQYNGPEGCNRYIISQCNSALNAMEVYALFLLNGWKKEELNIDIVPLFETVDDLENASDVMKSLYTDPVYRKHLKLRGNRQTIMLGFSDGTKDGGYLMANWSIYKAKEEILLREMAEKGYGAYKKLKDHPYLADYLLQVSPLRFYSETNIGSRPSKRGSSSGLSLKDLRAIPFAGSWSQLKQNVTGYYGVGSALQQMDKEGKWVQVQKLYRNSLFFKTLLDNCEMAMLKSFFPLTEFLSTHEQFGELWNMIYGEYELTCQYLSKLTGHNELMADYPVDQLSIQMRERIVQPLLTIQQYGLTRIREMEEQQQQSPLKEVYEKLVMRCSFGIINAGRNSA